MESALKVIAIVVVLLLLIFPLLPFKAKFFKFITFNGLKYKVPHQKKNFPYIFLILVEFVILAVAYEGITSLANLTTQMSWLQNLISSVQTQLGSQADFIVFVILALLINLFMVYGTIFLKGLLKSFVLDPAFGFSTREKFSLKKSIKNRKERKAKKRANKAKNGNKTEKNEEIPVEEVEKAEETPKENDPEVARRVERFEHSSEDVVSEPSEKEKGKTKESEKSKDIENKTEKEEEKRPRILCGLFFEEEDDYIHPYGWVWRARKILQIFIWIVEVAYILFFLFLLISIFYQLTAGVYSFLLENLQIRHWYLYPFISTLFLQEICNTLDGTLKDVKPKGEKEKEESEKAEAERDLRGLQVELIKRFDEEHRIRYFPECPTLPLKEYKCTNIAYASALSFIKRHMEENAGRSVQSYLETLDALYGGNNVYFAGSFYSEIGEYLIAYIYTRLLAGSRIIFITSKKEQVIGLKNYISERLIHLAGVFDKIVWRVCTTSERIDQTDVLIATPEDFMDDRMVVNHIRFFEEVSNAFFIDSDRMIEMQSYLCLIMAMRLQYASKNRCKFVFMSNLVYRGFAASNLPKFFNCEKVLTFSSAKESESVAYSLWNKESVNNRIYNLNGQRLNSLECIVANLAYNHDIDGVKVFSNDPIDHAAIKVLGQHGVEFNDFRKEIPDVNYLIYSDDGYNLATSLYSCTRFRGKYKSVVNILSKPYLLREYFMYKVAVDDYINRSPFVQPHVTEHIDELKFSLLKIYLECSNDKMLVQDFVAKCRDVIKNPLNNNPKIIQPEFCKALLEKKSVDELTLDDLASYLIAGICDPEGTPIEESKGKFAKDFYIISNLPNQNGYVLSSEKEEYISFYRSKHVVADLLAGSEVVNLYLNDNIIGQIDTFPERVETSYLPGQSIHFNNTEYEIESISDDRHSIFLRHETVIFQNTYDTIFLRRYQVKLLERAHKELADAVLFNSHSPLEEIRVCRYNAEVRGETYGFYSIMADHQRLDLAHGVEGNPILEKEIIDKHSRVINGPLVLKVSLKTRMDVTDNMRLLMSAVFNEFIRTIFPHSYRCIAIAPVLKEPISIPESGMAEAFEDKVKSLYPYLTKYENGEEVSDRKMDFLFINDSREDVGVLDWFDDKLAHYMEEFIANVYSYLHWLKDNSSLKHYIYFGNDSLPSCYDLDGCCELLSAYNWILSDEGAKDYETAGHDKVFETTERCYFCHGTLESGRYQKFDDNRYICLNCASSAIRDDSLLQQCYQEVIDYLSNTYKEIIWAPVKAAFMPVMNLPKEKFLSECLYKINPDEGVIYVERDDPLNNVSISLLRGQIEFWQIANDLQNPYSLGQLYYEELAYLRANGKDEAADWIYEHLPESAKRIVDEITSYIKGNESNVEKALTSFTYMRERAADFEGNDDDEGKETDEDYSDSLYDPDETPRFWKRYLCGKKITDGEDKLSGDEDRNEGIDENIDKADDEIVDNVDEESTDDADNVDVDKADDESVEDTDDAAINADDTKDSSEE